MLISAVAADEKSKSTDAPDKDPQKAAREQLWERAQQLADDGQTAEAVEEGEKLLQQQQNVNAAEDDVIRTLDWLTDRYIELRQWKVAEDRARRCQELTLQKHGKNHRRATDANWQLDEVQKLKAAKAETVNEVLRLRAEVKKLRREEEHKQALTTLNKLIEVEETLFGKEHGVVAHRLNDRQSCRFKAEEFPTWNMLKETADVLQKALGDHHPDTILAAHNYGMNLGFNKHYKEAVPYLKLAADGYRAQGELKESAFADSLRGRCLSSIDQFQAAIRAHVAAYNDYVKLENKPGQSKELRSLGFLFFNTQDLKSAAGCFRRHMELVRQLKGTENEQYADALYFLANTLKRLSNYREALPLIRECADIREKVSGKKHEDYADAIKKLGELLCDVGRYAEAAPHFQNAADIRKELLGEDDIDYVMALHDLGFVYDNLGDPQRAEPIYLRCLKILEDTEATESRHYTTMLNNVADLYRRQGDYVRARPLFLKARDLNIQLQGPEHPNVAYSLNGLGSLYQEMGDFGRAEQCFLQSEAIIRKSFGEEHSSYAGVLHYLGSVCLATEQYVRAESFFLKCLELRKKLIGEQNDLYATTLNNLALTYQEAGELDKAMVHYEQCLAIRKKVQSELHPEYAMLLNNIGMLYKYMGEPQQAEKVLLDCLRVRRQIQNEEHPQFTMLLNNLAWTYRELGNTEQAESFHRQALEIYRRALARNAAVQSERQQLAMNQMLRHGFDGYLSLAIKFPEYQSYAGREVLRWKGATLVRQRAMRLAAADPAIADQFEEIQKLTRQLSGLTRVPPTDERKQQITALTAAKEQLEAELSTNSAAFRQAVTDVTYEQIQEAIPADGVLVDFLEFTRACDCDDNRPDHVHDHESLLAVIVKSTGVPQLVDLGHTTPLSAAIDRWRQSFGASEQSARAARAIRRQIWEPLLPHVDGASVVLVSTDGLLGQLPLAALPGREPDTYLLEDHSLALIPVPQLLPDLLQRQDATSLSRELLLVGDVDYDADPSAAPVKKRKRRRPGDNRGDLIDSTFAPLPETAGEVNDLQVLYADLFEADDDDVFSLKQSAASEDAFRKLARQFRHVHIATHGFFAPERAVSALSADSLNQVGRTLAVQQDDESSTPPPPLKKIIGIGVRLEANENGAVVRDVVPDGPAGTDGRLLAGDVIVGVGNDEADIQPLAGMTIEEMVKLIQGPEGSVVRLHVVTADETEPVVYDLVRRDVSAALQETPKEPTQLNAIGWNPGLLSGLVLAGANLLPEPGQDDGILTAQEIAFLPLNGVDTVVLSACETGLGKVAGGEGLIGIQRAFQVAGARTTIASLWKVDDLVTRRLMERFYRNLWDKEMTHLEALREAQLYILNNPESIRGATIEDQKTTERIPPYYWAAFQLSGDWR